MPEVIPVTSDTVDRLPADLPRMVRLALGYGARLRYGSLEVTLPDGRAVKLGDNAPGPAAAMKVYHYGFASRLIRGGDIGIAEPPTPRAVGLFRSAALSTPARPVGRPVHQA